MVTQKAVEPNTFSARNRIATPINTTNTPGILWQKQAHFCASQLLVASVVFFSSVASTVNLSFRGYGSELRERDLRRNASGRNQAVDERWVFSWAGYNRLLDWGQPSSSLHFQRKTRQIAAKNRDFPPINSCCAMEKSVEGYCMAAASAIKARRANSVMQFSVFTPNRLGRLNDLVKMFGSNNVHVLALTVLDTTDTSIIRTVVDDPDKARELLQREGFAFTESQLVVVEVTSPDELNRLIAAVLEAELNINYLYSFIPHPNGKSIVGLSMEDNDVAEQVIRRHQFPVLKQSDISR